MFISVKALNVTGNSGLQVALDWLEINGDDESKFVEASKSKQETCLMCNQCKKSFKSLEQAELHAARTLHDDFIEAAFGESSEFEIGEGEAAIEIEKVLTEDEKAARLLELRAKVAKKREAREKETRESEVLRKASSKELEQIRREIQAKEMKKLAEERRQEKIADRKRKEMIKKQIEEDRENKKKQIESEKAKLSTCLDEIPSKEPTFFPTSNSNSSVARIQIKLPSPIPPLKLIFESPSSETLKSLKDRILSECPSINKIDELMQTFPTKIFNKSDDEKTLTELGLSPSSTLILK